MNDAKASAAENVKCPECNGEQGTHWSACSKWDATKAGEAYKALVSQRVKQRKGEIRTASICWCGDLACEDHSP